MDPLYILLAVLVVAIVGKADTVAIAAGFLLICKILKLDQIVFPVLGKAGVLGGIVLLVAAVMIPIAEGKVMVPDLWRVFTGWLGISAFVLSFFTTYLSGLGLKFLTVQGHGDVLPALILGAVFAAAFLGGVPVGPLITSGLLAIASRFFSK